MRTWLSNASSLLALTLIPATVALAQTKKTDRQNIAAADTANTVTLVDVQPFP